MSLFRSTGERADELGPTGGGAPVEAPARDTTILVGNPNVGKSLLFKNLTSHYVTVSNIPGTTDGKA